MTNRSLPAGYEWCDECSRTGREVEIEEKFDVDGYLIAEIPHDRGACETCSGKGYLTAAAPPDGQQDQGQRGGIQPTRYNRHGEPVFPRIPSPARGSTRCDECRQTGVSWCWRDIETGELVDDAENARLEVTACESCEGNGWYPPKPARPAAKPRPARDWDPCDSCGRRGGYYSERDAAPWWEWTPCDDCSALNGWDNPDGSYNDGLGWHPPEVGTVEEQDEQRRLARKRLHG